jgi:prepilin-type N-terminal cleavage/methylation domain-containing protein
MKPMNGKNKSARGRGFSLIELMISVVIMTTVIGVAVEGLMKLEQRNTMEATKVDLTQESREFMDQIVSDIHQAGFPSLHMYDPATGANLNSNNVSAGLINVTASSIQFEADVDGSGTVSEVYIQLNPLNGPCPCTIQRGTVAKGSGALPVYYTEVNNINNTNIFTGYDNSGNTVALNGVPSNNLAAIEITLSIRSPVPESNLFYPIISMSTAAKISNLN